MKRLIALFLVFVLVACNPAPSTGKRKTFAEHQELTVAISTDIQALDPRMIRDLVSANVAHMLFEGLMHTNYYGHVVPGIARGMQISEDGLTYIFTLRESRWSDGSPLTAHDFEYTWKSILDPAFPSPIAYQLYAIKGARAAKEGKGSVAGVGVKAVDDETLKVDLEQPTPYFAELLTTHYFFPVSKKWAESGQKQLIVSNGPFKLEHWRQAEEVAVVKNPTFWSADTVKLERITAVPINDDTALKMFERGEIDWTGSPMGMVPSDAVATLKMQGKLQHAPAAMTLLFRINTEKPPFNNMKIRKAFNLAIDRSNLVEYIIRGGHTPATGFVPTTFGLQVHPYFADHDIPGAWSNFQEGLKELGISKDDLPAITLCYSSTDRNHKVAQAVQQQWVSALGVDVKLEPCESTIYFDRMQRANYQIGIGSWGGDYRDPMSFLEIFRSKDTGTNNTRWESAAYAEMLDRSMTVYDRVERLALLGKAEQLLIDEAPIIPVFHLTYNYLKKKDVNGVYFSELGYLDFRHAYRGQ